MFSLCALVFNGVVRILINRKTKVYYIVVYDATVEIRTNMEYSVIRWWVG